MRIRASDDQCCSEVAPQRRIARKTVNASAQNTAMLPVTATTPSPGK